MGRKDRGTLAERIADAAEAALAAQNYVCCIDVMERIGWLYPEAAKHWRVGKFECLEDAVQSNPSRISEAMRLFQTWAEAKGLIANEAQYVARTPQRGTLRFSRSGDEAVERAYRTHWVSPSLAENQRERLTEKASRAPDLVVIQPLNDWTCHKCGGTGDLLIMEAPGPACLRCVGLNDLEFLPGGNALLTRRRRQKHATRCRRSIQQEPPPLRATGPAGRATVPGQGATRTREARSRLNAHSGTLVPARGTEQPMGNTSAHDSRRVPESVIVRFRASHDRSASN
jgi:hypothetical protein